MARLNVRTNVRVECSCGWKLPARWWATFTWEEAIASARGHDCRNGRWDARLWPELHLEVSPLEF